MFFPYDPPPWTHAPHFLDRRDNGILLVTLNRPEAANAMNAQSMLDLLIVA